MVRSYRTCLEEILCWKSQLWRGKTTCRCYITDEFWSSISPNIKTPFSIIDDSVLSRVLFAWPRICAFWANLQNIKLLPYKARQRRVRGSNTSLIRCRTKWGRFCLLKAGQRNLHCLTKNLNFISFILDGCDAKQKNICFVNQQIDNKQTISAFAYW